ncbi:hypothetical protein TNCV_2632461 [Trichonephila clavipes]|nr:hypothetical protein TNCV_2632461 [Trichonephila clavipes]
MKIHRLGPGSNSQSWVQKASDKPTTPSSSPEAKKVGKSGEIVSNLLTKLNIPLFKIPASEKELNRIIFRSKNKKIELSPVKIQEAKAPAAFTPPPQASLRSKGRKAKRRVLSALRTASADVDKTYVIFEAYCRLRSLQA